jgi:hypothetical protein
MCLVNQLLQYNTMKRKILRYYFFSVKSIVKVFAILCQASAFMHGSVTNNGGMNDVRINDLFTYVVYQVAIKNLGKNLTSIVYYLNPTPR